ncbi:ester cyclase [Francisella philomiragia]|uniref:ester cyclase n=1 Tax=Francisella philomiragia TaxID=28110 RepID=UPI001902DA2A|nr:ester cyclase [Francisella philomiragia]MBK2270218.1 ester cyclase [Francisella philomiragia]MBK2275882.1 ester cyclase [Francisella philomiragia]MBK2305096.1 ester cyclase [Francisella philomiragia]
MKNNKSALYKKRIDELLNSLWNDKEISAIDHYFSDISIIDSPLSTSIGSNAKKEIVNKWFNALPDVSYKTDLLICEDNTVISNWTCKASHLGSFMGANPTGEIIEYKGSSTFKFSDDNKISYYHAIANITDVMKSKNIEIDINKTTNFKDPSKIIGALKSAFNLNLNEIEIKVLALWMRSVKPREMGEILYKSHRTIEGYISKIRSKLEIHNPIQIAEYLKSIDALTMLDAIYYDITIKNSKPKIWIPQ